jgi:aromatic-L-amino-acid/L-tryptophan decarboxylase
MPMPAPAPTEISLDPIDPERFRALGHRMLDDMLDHLAALRDRPAWRPIPDDVRAALREPLPRAGEGEEAAYQAFAARVLPYPNGNLHPRFWGWVQGTGTPLAMLADMLASGLNPHLAGFHQAPALVEHQVIAWLAEMMGFPAGSSGLLVSGGTMANLLGLAVARHAKAGYDVREEGLAGGRPQLVFYGSTETHGWALKAAELMGLGRRAFRRVAVDDAGRLDPRALAAAIASDRSLGLHPFAVIATAGTVNTGVIDDLPALVALCRREDLWLHVDGAFGALARLSPALRDRLVGLEEADSLGIDLHKWMYLPFDVACVLVRDAGVHRATFASTAPYLGDGERGPIAGGLPFADRGIELTRSFKALKVWMSLKAYGVETFAALIEQNVALARYLAERVAAHPQLELLAPVTLNVVCFRYAPAGLADEALDRLNRECLLRVQESGVAVPSSTVIDGRFALRVAIVNHRSRREDFDALLDAVLRIGADLARIPQRGLE